MNPTPSTELPRDVDRLIAEILSSYAAEMEEPYAEAAFESGLSDWPGWERIAEGLGQLLKQAPETTIIHAHYETTFVHYNQTVVNEGTSWCGFVLEFAPPLPRSDALALIPNWIMEVATTWGTRAVSWSVIIAGERRDVRQLDERDAEWVAQERQAEALAAVLIAWQVEED